MSIIPVRCFTCGKVLADKYRFYQDQVADIQKRENITDETTIPGQYYEPRVSIRADKPTAIKRVCDMLRLERCCVKTMMSHVNIE